MGHRDVVGEEPNQDRLDVFARWDELAKWAQAALARRLPAFGDVGVMHRVVDGIQALEDAKLVPNGSGALAEELWQLMARAAEEPITPQEAQSFLSRASSLINRQV